MRDIKETLRNNRWPLFFAILIICVLALRYYNNVLERNELAVKAGNWDKLMLVMKQIDENYVDSIKYDEITETAIPLILESLDPHSVYLPPKELMSAEEELEGNFDGIGVQFNVPNDTAIIIQVIAGGPSERAGVLSGDRIVKVGEKIVAGVKLDQDSLVGMLKGRSGSVVRLGLKRGSSKKLLFLDIKRDRIPVKSIDVSYMANDTLGYIKLSKFSRTSHKEFLEAVKELKKKGMKSLIFDIRGNTGGYLDQALLLSNEFLSKDNLIVYMQGKHRKREDFHADGRGSCRNIGLKILIDEGSASSSEIFAGAIQDNDRGVIIGRRSFGKGLVQEPIYFTDKSGIRLTVARFYTPTGRSIQKPYSKDYRNDIIERFRHGEMSVADSIKKDKSLMFKTPKGKIVYGGGGITPDIFVGIDTSGVNDFLVKSNEQGVVFRFSSQMADIYRERLRKIQNLQSLNQFFESVGYEKMFLNFASAAKLVPTSDEWKQCKDIVLTQVRALVGRYTPMDDNAFYPIMSEIDKVIQIAKKSE
jgi:carboxyl-terminal processing protease